ncbi:MAG: sulfite exporter TauE/SafE family protein [Saprospiraceae bacterium]|nr:sulfite exporter TauE/SafE family protein [Saprospiraceae bacterium]
MEWYQYVIIIVGSFFAGVINTLAGNGSAITLTILTEIIGLPGNLANGTNRIGVFTQGTASAYGFYQGGRLILKGNWLYIMTIIVGALIGVIIAVTVSNEQFKIVFRYLMVFMLLVLLVKPERWLRETDINRPSLWIMLPMLLILGLYGGFIQMGMGIVFLIIIVLIGRFSLMEANALKAFVIAAYTLLVLIIFHWQGLVDWKIGLTLALGQTVGGYLTARIASSYPNANVWAHRLLIFIILAAVVKLFWEQFYSL